MTSDEFRTLVRSFPHTEEAPHFDRAAFKVTKKRIFATLHPPSNTANMKLSEVDQSVFSDYGKDAIFKIPNKWGQQGWTTFVLDKVPYEVMQDALDCAYKEVFKVKPRK
jgi:hypothetical protein